jgi:transporter family-2 protein
MGAIIVLGITFAAPRIGTTATVAIFVFAQFAAAAVVDRYGLFGLDRIPVSGARIAGLVLLGIGAALALKK